MSKIICNTAANGATPRLSVLIPFYKDDASALINALSAQNLSQHVEIILVDDGTGDANLTAKTTQAVMDCKPACTLITLAQNQGRAKARNHLQSASKADWILFLDADMRPVKDNFLENYLSLIEANMADVFFGGFTVEAKSQNKLGELHRALSAVSDCLPLHERQAAGPQFVASSNLCIRKSVIEDNPFDDGFQGWGWEDSEWAARIASKHTLLHVDNPALHLGLESTDTLLNRFSSSGANYARFTQKHPELAKTLTLFQLSNKLKSIPGQKLIRPFLKLIVKLPFPIKARLIALKLWRASWYAEALS